MTPANPEALADALVDWLSTNLPLTRSCARPKAEAIISGPLAPLLTDLQRVTAERDAEQAEDARFAIAYTTARGAMDYEHMARVLSGRLRRMDRRAAAANRRADTAEARAAQLQAEVEALREALTVAASRMEVASMDWGIAAALNSDKLTHADDMERWAKHARTALAARAATAREGA